MARRGLHLRLERRKFGPGMWRQQGIIGFEDPFPLGQNKRLVFAKLRQSDGRTDIGHVHLEPRVHDIVLPAGPLRLGQRIFGLAIERPELQGTVHLLVVKVGRGEVDTHGAAFRRGDVLHRMEGEHREVGPVARGLSVVRCADAVRRVGEDHHPSEFSLGFSSRRKLLSYGRFVDDLKDGRVVAGPPGDIDGDNSFRPCRDRLPDRCRIHIEVCAAIDHDRCGTQVHDGECGGGIRIGRDNHLIAAGNPVPMKKQQEARGGRVAAGDRGNSGLLSDQLFQRLHPRPGGDPSGIQGVHDLLADVVVDEGG